MEFCDLSFDVSFLADNSSREEKKKALRDYAEQMKNFDPQNPIKPKLQ